MRISEVINKLPIKGLREVRNIAGLQKVLDNNNIQVGTEQIRKIGDEMVTIKSSMSGVSDFKYNFNCNGVELTLTYVQNNLTRFTLCLGTRQEGNKCGAFGYIKQLDTLFGLYLFNCDADATNWSQGVFENTNLKTKRGFFRRQHETYGTMKRFCKF